MERQQTVALIVQAANDLLESIPGATPADENTILIGEESILESMDLVSLIVDVEGRIEKETGLSLTLTDERAMSRDHSPFQTVSTLADYILELAMERSVG